MRASSLVRPRHRRVIFVTLGLSAFAALVALVWGTKLTPPTPTERDTFGASETGHRLLFDWLVEEGRQPYRARTAPALRRSGPLLFIEPREEAVLDGETIRLDAILTERSGQGAPTLVVLPKWRLVEREGKRIAIPDSDGAQRVLSAVASARVRRSGVTGQRYAIDAGSARFSLDLPDLQTVSAHGGEVHAAAEEGAVLLQFGSIWVLSDPDVLHNWSLVRADHAAFVSFVADRIGGSALGIDEVFHGHGRQRSLAAALGEFPAVFLLVHFILIAVVVLVRGAWRFGPPATLRPRPFGPGESIATSAALMSQGRGLGLLVSNYVDFVVADLVDKLHLPRQGSVVERAGRIDAFARRRFRELDPDSDLASTLTADAHELVGRRRVKVGESLELARRAHRLRRRLLGLSPLPAHHDPARLSGVPRPHPSNRQPHRLRGRGIVSPHPHRLHGGWTRALRGCARHR
ncbi:MAG: hypothetical protein AAGA56_02905 [Myxococcota bacterium]